MNAATQFRSRSSVEHCEPCEQRRQRIMSHAESLRSRSGIAARQPITLKNGDLFLSRLETPQVTVAPNAPVPVETTVSNGAIGGVPILNDDLCSSGANPCDGAGMCFSLTVNPSWERGEKRGPRCISSTEVGTKDEDFMFEFQSPSSPGTYSIEISLELPGSGESGSVSRQIRVEKGGNTNPDPGNGDNGNNGGNGGPNIALIGATLALLVVAVAGVAI